MDGSDYIDVDNSDRNSQGTIALWANPRESNSDGTLASYIDPSGEDLLRYGLDDGNVSFYLYNGTIITNAVSDFSVNVDEWSHFAISSNGSDYSFYINGNEFTPTFLDGSDNGAWLDELSSNTKLYIGRWSGLGRYFNGTIDDFRTFNRSLSQTEIRNLYACRPNSRTEWDATARCEISGETYADLNLYANINNNASYKLTNSNYRVNRSRVEGSSITLTNSTWRIN
jgi:hypothetical protein